MSHIRVGEECQNFRLELQRAGLLDPITHLYRPSLLIPLAQLALAVMLVAGAAVGVLRGSLFLLPVGVVMIASQQRVLKNILHDAAHRNLCTKRRWNDALAKYLLAPLKFEDFTAYRERHVRHHAHLGSALDPDLLQLDVDGHRVKSPWILYARLLLSWSTWKNSVCESLPSLRARERCFIVGWWAALLAALGFLTDGAAVAGFFGLWMLSKATVYHCIQAFTELCDHALLRPTSIMDYTRNMPKNLLSVLLHPYNDNYHLTHHLMPCIPMMSLAKAHRLMLGIERYASGIQCDSYFFGRRSLVKTLMPERPRRAQHELARGGGPRSLAVHPAGDYESRSAGRSS